MRKSILTGRAVPVAIVIASGFAASTTTAATIRDDVADATIRVNSAAATFASTGYVTVNVGGGNFLLGTGVLIRPDWVLTAAHVVTNTSAVPFAPSQVTFGQGAGIPGTLTGSFGVSQVVTAPGWAYDFNAGNDLALLHLTGAVAGVTPANLFTSALGSEKTLASTLVGYGRQGTGSAGAVAQGDQQRRATTNTIDAFGGETTTGPTGSFSLAGFNSRLLFEDFDNPLNAAVSTEGSTAATTFEGLSAEGDSGGGLYVTVGGASYVAGITSFGTSYDFSAPPNSGYGDIAGFTRVSQFSSFIAATVPEPTTAFLAAGLLGATTLRRTRRA